MKTNTKKYCEFKCKYKYFMKVFINTLMDTFQKKKFCL